MTDGTRYLAILGGLCIASCSSIPILPTTSSEHEVIDGYLSAQAGLRLYGDRNSRDARSNEDCIQVLRPESIQTLPIPEGRVRVAGRLGVFEEIFELAKLQMGADHATHELCEARYLIVQDITDLSRE